MLSVLSKPIAIVILISALLAGAGFGLWRAAAVVERMVDTAAANARLARDNHWRAEINASEVLAAKNMIEQMRASRAADLAAQAEIIRLKNQVSELEAKNETLPDRDGSGIDLDRSRLLNNQLIGGQAYPAH